MLEQLRQDILRAVMDAISQQVTAAPGLTAALPSSARVDLEAIRSQLEQQATVEEIAAWASQFIPVETLDRILADSGYQDVSYTAPQVTLAQAITEAQQSGTADPITQVLRGLASVAGYDRPQEVVPTPQEAVPTTETSLPVTPGLTDEEPAVTGFPYGIDFTGPASAVTPDEMAVEPPPIPLGDQPPTVTGRDPDDWRPRHPVWPRYFTGDQLDEVRTFTREELLQLQARLIDIGLLQPFTFTPGTWGQACEEAFAVVLGYANTQAQTDGRAVTWDVALNRLEETTPSPALQGMERYVVPSMSNLAERVRTIASGQLGRDLEPWETQELANHLSDAYRQTYEAEQAQALEDWQQQRTAALTEGTLAGGELAQPRIDQPPSPEDLFAQYFEQRYGPEIAATERSENWHLSNQNVADQLLNLNNMVTR